MGSPSSERYDELFATVAGQVGGLEPLLAAFFSFLHRRTDFYVRWDPSLASVQRPSMGFPTGSAEKILLRAFHTFPFKEYQPPMRNKGKAKLKQQQPEQVRSPSSSPDESGSNQDTGLQEAAAGSGGSAAGSVTATAAVRESSGGVGGSSVSNISTTGGGGGGGRGSAGGQAVSTTSLASPKIDYTTDGKQVPVGNGGVTSRYYWTQTLEETTVYVDVPAGTRGKDIRCDISPKQLRLALAGQDSPLLEGELGGTVAAEGSVWSVEGNRTVCICFDKAVKTWWKSVLQGDPEIDTSLVDSTQKIDEYDEETQGAIRKIMFDQRQKAMGLPTSEEIETDSILLSAMGLPGSPFLEAGGQG